MKVMLHKTLAILVLFALLLGVYISLVRPSQITWGATNVEVNQSMPGDDFVYQPTFKATRAITINALPEEIWPWVVQMGYGRAGFYGYDLLEGIGSPSGLRSAEELLPELQQIKVGDELQIFPGAYSMISMLEQNQYLVWGCENPPCTCAFTWALHPIDAAQTRLVSRAWCSHLTSDPRLFFFTEFFDHVGLKKILLGVKGRVEGRVEPALKQDLEFTLWLVGSIEFLIAVILVIILRSWRRAWLVALFSGFLLLSLYFIGYQVLLVLLLEIVAAIGLVWAGSRKQGIKPVHDEVKLYTA